MAGILEKVISLLYENKVAFCRSPLKEDIFGVCVLNVYFRIPLGGSLMSSWFIFTFDLNLVLLSSSCG